MIGDYCKDIYKYGTVERISPEAPVPIVKFSHEESRPGMAGNVKKNLEALGLEVISFFGPESIKTRIIDLHSKQHMLRIDNDNISPRSFEFTIIKDEIEEFDAIVISDYQKGWVHYTLIEEILKSYSGPIFIDTKKKDLARFEGCYVKINEQEYNQCTSIPSNLIVTLGKNGSMYKQKNLGLEQLFTGKNVEVVDVCGAGDTFLAALVAEYLNTGTIEQAIMFANRAGAICVQNTGVYTLTQTDIESIRKDLKRK